MPPTPRNSLSSSLKGEFFLKLYADCVQFTDERLYESGLVVVPRFSNGDFLLVRSRLPGTTHFSLDFPFAQPHNLHTSRANALNRAAASSEMCWDAHSVYRLGTLRHTSPRNAPNVYLAAVPDDSVQPGTCLEAVDEPLRIPAAHLNLQAVMGEVTDTLTLSALALLACHQECIRAKEVLPVLDRRKAHHSQLKVVRSC